MILVLSPNHLLTFNFFIMKKLFTLFAASLLAFTFNYNANAQSCETGNITQDNIPEVVPADTWGDCNGSFLNIGQSFTACETGQLNSITFHHGDIDPGSTTWNGENMQLFIQSGQAVGAPEYTQLFSMDPASGTQTVALTTAFPVTSGNQYTLWLRPPDNLPNCAPGAPTVSLSGFAGDVNDPFYIDSYAGGQKYWNGAFLQGEDLRMTFSIGAATSPSSNVPTLSQWGLMILGLSMLSLLVVYVGRMRLSKAN